MSYYGLSLNSGNMPGSLYVNMALSAAAEIIAYSLCFICFVAGRKWPHVVSMSLGGLACGASVLIYYFYEGENSSPLHLSALVQQYQPPAIFSKLMKPLETGHLLA